MKRRSLATLVLAACTAWAMSAHAGSPLSRSADLLPLAQVETRSFDALDLQSIAEADAVAEAMGQPARFAIAHEAGFDTRAAGTWEVQGDTSVWRYRVHAKGATSFNFGFGRYRLPEGAELYFTSGDGAIVVGPYTSQHNAEHGELWTPIVSSDDVVIELNVPTASRELVDLRLDAINQGYRAFGPPDSSYRQPALDLGMGGKACKDGNGRSGACNTDVMCLSEGDPWNLPRRSVGAYSRSGQFACTGSLVNNTANDQRMLFATATHCGVTAGSAPSMVVYWNYEWPTCRRPGAAGGTNVNPPDIGQSNSGAIFLAATGNPFGACSGPTCSDFTLVELDDPANPDFDLYWSGWNRSETGATCTPPADPTSTDGLCASIHHPGVDEKRITFIDQDLITANIAGATGVHWLTRWDQTPPQLPNFPAGGALPPSVTEGGSSGSPVYNADQQLVGVLSGGASFCGASPGQLTDQYGKLAHAWEGTGTATTQMRPYLDPVGGNPVSIGGIGGSPFALEVDPGSAALCATAGSAAFDIDVVAVEPGFSDPVTLTVSGVPTGSTTAFSANPVSPPGSSVLTLGALGGATPGAYSMVINGNSGGTDATATVPVTLSAAAPGAVSLQTPANGATGQSTSVTLTWAATAAGDEYLVELANDAAFTDIEFSTVTSATSVATPALAAGASYFWRVTADNACGAGATSTVFTFTVASGPGACDGGTVPSTVFEEDFTGGLGAFTTTGSVGTSTWAISARPGSPSGGNTVRAVGLATVSDQRLISPPIALPTGQSPLTLQFWNDQTLEDFPPGACYDGGILEVSSNAGATWTPLQGAALLQGAHDGPISAGFANPLANAQAWCGDPRAWQNYIVDVNAYAGQTVQFRWRLGTDTSVGRPDGWHVDDIRVQSCQSSDVIFAHGFEAAP